MLYATRTHGAKKAFGAREIEKMIKETKKVPKMVNGQETMVDKEWEYFKMTPLEWLSYDESLQDIKNIGSGLRKLGSGSEDETFFNIYAATS